MTTPDDRPISTDTAIILPQRERYAPGEAGAIALLAARLAGRDDRILGIAPAGAPYPAGSFTPVRPAAFGLSDTARYARGCVSALGSRLPDLIEVHNRPDVALRIARARPHVPMLLVLHNDPQSMRDARTPEARIALLRRMRIAGVSDWVRARFLDGLPSSADLMAVLPNCIDCKALPNPVPMAERRREILFAGRIVADKGADAFVRACAQILPRWPGWTARMIGADRFGADTPRTAFLDALVPQARAAGIVMDGYRPHDAVLNAMAQAAVVVVPSRWPEPFGLTALEAMATGAALIASPKGALSWVVQNGGLIADPDEPAALETALEHVLSDLPLRESLSAQGQARARLFNVAEAREHLSALRADVRARPFLSPEPAGP
jgi:UDP-glucose:(glucosyl)LPS alpha-1,2-glucosyltransferase